MATLVICNWHCECSACGWGTSQGFHKIAPALPGIGGSMTFACRPQGDISPGVPPIDMDHDSHCPRCGEEFTDTRRLYTS